MQTIKNIKDFLQIKKVYKDKKVGFIPTMGALHEGHISLIKRAKNECEVVVVSIFVNPTQFNDKNDFIKYPKKDEDDIAICENLGVNYLLMPNLEQVYFDDEVLIKAPSIRGHILEGQMRDGHFDGVLRVVMKLFNIVSANVAYFGKKDAQQLFLIKQMARDMFLDVSIVGCETVRESSGLALSSRNIRLKNKDKALLIYKALNRVDTLVKSKQMSVIALKNEVSSILGELTLEYISFVSRDFKEIETIEPNNSIMIVAVFVDGVRLIDNIYL